MTYDSRGRWFAWYFVMSVTILAACAGSGPFFKQVESAEIVVYHRMFPAYRETTTVRPGESIAFGDQDYTLKIADFFPDFQMDAAGKVFSRSDSLGNPALKVVVFRGREKVEEGWAFRGEGPPHFRQSTRFGFRLQDLKLKAGGMTSGVGEQEP